MEQKQKLQGIITDTYPSLKFRVRLDNGDEVFAYLSGKMRLYKIKILCGDKVVVEISEYDKKKGRIIYRLNQ